MNAATATQIHTDVTNLLAKVDLTVAPTFELSANGRDLVINFDAAKVEHINTTQGHAQYKALLNALFVHTSLTGNNGGKGRLYWIDHTVR